MRVRRLFAALALSVGLLGVTGASQALASGDASSRAANPPGTVITSSSYDPTTGLTIVTGYSPAGAADTVDGMPATQAPGTFSAGTPTTALTQPGLSSNTIVPYGSSNGCQNAGVNWSAAYALAGDTVWKIWNHTHWCNSSWDVSSVTGWTDIYTGVGWTSSNKTWGWAWWNKPHTAYTSAHAHFCLGAYFACIQTADPTVHTWINGAGNYSFDDSNWHPGTPG